MPQTGICSATGVALATLALTTAEDIYTLSLPQPPVGKINSAQVQFYCPDGDWLWSH